MTFQAAIVNAGPAGEQVLRLDAEGNHIDAHDGDLLVAPDGSYWWYGTSYDCGFQLLTPGNQWCGIKAYRSTDLMQWHDMGFMVNPDPTWQTRCAMPHYGCFNAHVARRPTGDYIMWINGFDNNSGYHLLTAPDPGGPWTDIAGEPTLAHMGPPTGANGACDLFVDPDTGTPWIAYVDLTRGHIIVIEQLNATMTSGTGAAVDATGIGAEPPALFKRGSTYYLAYGTQCEYCAGATWIRSAPSPLGPWSAPIQLNSTSCAGQLSWIAQVGSQYLLATDQWVNGAPNQALARYFWTPLAFTGTTPQPFTCPAEVSLSVDGAPTWEPPTADQSAGDYGWRTWCDISAAYSRLQSFTPARSGILTAAAVMAYRSTTAPNAPLFIDVQRVSAALTPVGPILARGTFPNVGWSPVMQSFNPAIPVRAGIRYALILRTISTVGCYGFAYSDLGPYANGGAAYKGSGAWISEAPRSLNFAIEVT
jgi:hypothetical protein